MEYQNNLGPSDYDVVFSEETADLFRIADDFVGAIGNVVDNETVEPSVFFEYVLHKLPNEVLGQMLLQMPLMESPGQGYPEGRVNRNLALAVADELGPDWAQAFYRFAVLVTKLA